MTERDTIGVDAEAHEVYKHLTEGDDPSNVPFRTMKDVFMWAMVLGYRLGERHPLGGRRVTIFRWAQLAPQTDVPLLKALAIADSGDTDVLRGRAEILTIAEEYANAGIHDLRARILEERGQPLWNLVELSARSTRPTEG